jgi:hypothetical protein
MNPPDPFVTAEPDRHLLLEQLDAYRAVIANKLDGLDDGEVRRVRTPTGLHLLGIVRHLAWVERRWIQHYVTGAPKEGTSIAESFMVPVDEGAADVLRD